MIENKETFPDGPERIFVLACHEAWRRRLGQIWDKVNHNQNLYNAQVDSEFTHARMAFSRCKNATSFREAVTDFWARSGGHLKSLQEGWHDVLTLLDETNWRKGRDLALLALVSYKPLTKEKTEAQGIEIKGEEKSE